MSLQWMITRRASSFGKLGVKSVFVFCSRGKQRVERGLEIGERIVWGEDLDERVWICSFVFISMAGWAEEQVVS